MAQNRMFHFSDDGTWAETGTIGEADRLRKSGGFIWLAYVSPEKDSLTTVIPTLGIHPLSVEDCFDEDQIPKIDLFPEYTGILFNDYRNEADNITLSELNFFLGKDFLVSVFRDETARWLTSETILGDLASGTGTGITGPARVLHIILDRVVDAKFGPLESVGDLISGFEDRVMEKDQQANPAELQVIRRNLMLMRKSLFHERELLVRISRRDSPFIPEPGIAFFNNLLDHVSKYVDLVETNRETVTNLMQIHLSLTNNAMAEAANRTNRSVSRLTFITTIFMPLTLVAGIGGMSEWSMMTGPDNWRWTYPILVGAMALMGILNFIVLKWIDRRK